MLMLVFAVWSRCGEGKVAGGVGGAKKVERGKFLVGVQWWAQFRSIILPFPPQGAF